MPLTRRAGVLVIVPPNKVPGTWDVLLVGEQKKGAIELTIPSGGMHHNERACIAAVRELIEETRGVVNPSWIKDFSKQPNVTFVTKHSSFRVYLLRVGAGHYCSAYNSVNTAFLPAGFKETVTMRRVPLINLRNPQHYGGKTFCIDDSGVTFQVAYRALGAINHMDSSGLLNAYF